MEAEVLSVTFVPICQNTECYILVYKCYLQKLYVIDRCYNKYYLQVLVNMYKCVMSYIQVVLC
jgi:hypothetical protein